MHQDSSFLPQFITEELYIVPEKSTKTNVVEEGPPQYLPKDEAPRKGSLLVIIDHPEEEENETLKKLLMAIKTEQATFATEWSEGYEKVLVFSDRFPDPKYQVTKKEGSAMLVSDGLSSLEKDTSLKHQLWAELKKMFL